MQDDANAQAAPAGASEVAPARPSLVQRFRKPDAEAVRSLAATTPFLWVWAALLSLAALQIYFDPFGFSSLTQRYSQDLANLTVTGPLYPDDGSNQVSVALIVDDSLHALGMQWPMSYGDHARALDSLLVYEPRAVAVDILFVDERDDPSYEQLLTVIERYKRAGVPLYFVGSPRTKPVRPEIVAAGARIVDSTILFDDGVARTYPIRVTCLDGRRDATCPSLAVRIYNDAFRANAGADAPPNSNIELVWGVDTHPINRKWMKVVDANGQRRECPQLNVLQRVWGALLDVSTLRSQCPHSGVIPAETLIRGDDDQDIRTLTEDRIVFYGASLEGSDDRAYTPVNGLLAGVFVHAMALDNLVSYGGKPKRDSVTVFGVGIYKNEIELFVIAMILLVMTALHLRRIRALASAQPGEETDVPAVRRRMAYLRLTGMILVSGIILYGVFGLSIGNWVELVFISGVLFEFLMTPYLALLWGRTRYVLGV
jgi:CHASE2 domain-containing sensor protein